MILTKLYNMKNSLLLTCSVFVCVLSCKKPEVQNDRPTDSTLPSGSPYDSSNVTPMPQVNKQTDSVSYQHGSDTLKQTKQKTDSVVR